MVSFAPAPPDFLWVAPGIVAAIAAIERSHTKPDIPAAMANRSAGGHGADPFEHHRTHAGMGVVEDQAPNTVPGAGESPVAPSKARSGSVVVRHFARSASSSSFTSASRS